MRDALCADLAALGHQVVVTADPRFPLPRPASREVVLAPRSGLRLVALAARVDAVWLIAPETGRLLEHVAARLARAGVAVLGSSAAAIRAVADKRRLAARLRRLGVPHPETRIARTAHAGRSAASRLGLPVILKPALGAGCEGVSLVTELRGIEPAFASVRRVAPRGPCLVQRQTPGLPASVSLLVSARQARVLAVNRQILCGNGSPVYRGGLTPFAHPLARRAAELARRACEGVEGLRGYVGVDVVLGERDVTVIEVNPRLTTSYLGLRRAFDRNLAGSILAACRSGGLQRMPRAVRQVRFSVAGLVGVAAP